MASLEKTMWSQPSEDLAQVAQVVGQSVLAVQPQQSHAASGVATNHSVPGDEVTVIVPGGQSTAARLKGRDPGTALAII